MKKRLRQKLLKKAHAIGQIAVSSPSALEGDAKLFAVECWRIKKLLPEFSDNRKALVLTSSVEKMIAALASSVSRSTIRTERIPRRHDTQGRII